MSLESGVDAQRTRAKILAAAGIAHDEVEKDELRFVARDGRCFPADLALRRSAVGAERQKGVLQLAGRAELGNEQGFAARLDARGLRQRFEVGVLQGDGQGVLATGGNSRNVARARGAWGGLGPSRSV